MPRLPRLLLLPALAVLLSGLALSPVSAAPQTGATATAADASAFIQNLGNKALSLLGDKSLSLEMRDVKLREMMRDSFDLMTIGRFVIGRNWLVATPEQQKEYMKLFEELVVKTYSDRFALYTGEGFRVKTASPEGDRDFIVNSEITRPDGSPATAIDWRLRFKNGKLGIIDVVVEGVSMSVTQRQEYASVIERNGGNIDGLLDVMRKHLQDPAKAVATQKS